jgi:hypothetical protein
VTTRIKPKPQNSPRRPRRTTRPLDLFGVLPGAVSTAAMDDTAEAEALFDDLLALLDAGLIEAIDDDRAVRYAAVDTDGQPCGTSVPVADAA